MSDSCDFVDRPFRARFVPFADRPFRVRFVWFRGQAFSCPIRVISWTNLFVPDSCDFVDKLFRFRFVWFRGQTFSCGLVWFRGSIFSRISPSLSEFLNFWVFLWRSGYAVGLSAVSLPSTSPPSPSKDAAPIPNAAGAPGTMLPILINKVYKTLVAKHAFGAGFAPFRGRRTVGAEVQRCEIRGQGFSCRIRDLSWKKHSWKRFGFTGKMPDLWYFSSEELLKTRRKRRKTGGILK